MTITTPSSVLITRDSENTFRIKIMDKISRSATVVATLTAEQFAQAVTSLQIEDAEAIWHETENVGLKREMKPLMIPFDEIKCDWKERAKTVQDWINNSGELVDGWQINSDGVGTRQDGSAHIASLVRFVEDEK